MSVALPGRGEDERTMPEFPLSAANQTTIWVRFRCQIDQTIKSAVYIRILSVLALFRNLHGVWTPLPVCPLCRKCAALVLPQLI